MTTRAASGAFGAPDEAYSRQNEAQFRAAVAREVAQIRARVEALPMNSVFFDVRGYVKAGVAEFWDDAFEAADADAVAADGIVLVPPGTFKTADDLEMLAPILFAGGLVQPANGKTITVNTRTLTALAGEWLDQSAGGDAVRLGDMPSALENGLYLAGSLIQQENTKHRLDGSDTGDTYLHSPSADVVELFVGGTKMLKANATQMAWFDATLSALQAYTVTNGTVSRTFDADTVTLPQLADIVYTLLKDMTAPGVVVSGVS